MSRALHGAASLPNSSRHLPIVACPVNGGPWNPTKSGSRWSGLPLATVGFKARLRTEGQHAAAVWWAAEAVWSRWPLTSCPSEKYRFPLPVWGPWKLPLNDQACPSPAEEATGNFYPTERSDIVSINAANSKGHLMSLLSLSSFFLLLCDCQEKLWSRWQYNIAQVISSLSEPSRPSFEIFGQVELMTRMWLSF